MGPNPPTELIKRTNEEILSFHLKAKNYAEDSENKIHGEDAARHGFRGGLVPGIGVYAYLTRALVMHFGSAWIERGWASVEFHKPVYDGDDLHVRLIKQADESKPGSVRGEVFVAGQDITLAVLQGGIQNDEIKIRTEDYPDQPLPQPNQRRPPTLADCPVGTILGSRTLTLDLNLAARTFVADVLDPAPIYSGPDAVAHPALLLAQANFILRDNIALGSWIHTGSRVMHYGAVRHGETIALRGKISEAYERKGHQYITADLGLFSGTRPVAHFLHTAIIRLRGD